MPYAAHEIYFIDPHSDDMDLCHLLQTMKLEVSNPEKTSENVVHILPTPNIVADEVMEEDRTYQPDTVDPQLASSNSDTREEGSFGCGYLRAVRHQMDWGEYPTTGGEYLDAIFTHREILYAQPSAHQECARAFSDIATLLQKRAWRADREADPEAVAAFNHEAWVIASTLSPTQNSADSHRVQSQSVCVMMPMM
ncbi:hypothetical protein CPB83DRAFT_893216 [Crepidotus variabilis]|uniref:Uncharacterized protein n=1 Tax=Crepidotus variabilis TaxID=179855 RepID=A0A9P6EIX7_9AGAR|nr:hypothetical protein CPB83DRAFT_893216 [Crepidotus variabilis]